MVGHIIKRNGAGGGGAAQLYTLRKVQVGNMASSAGVEDYVVDCGFIPKTIMAFYVISPNTNNLTTSKSDRHMTGCIVYNEDIPLRFDGKVQVSFMATLPKTTASNTRVSVTGGFILMTQGASDTVPIVIKSISGTTITFSVYKMASSYGIMQELQITG